MKRAPIQFQIAVLPLRRIRHQNVGDWRYSKKRILAMTADTGNADSNLLVALHELIEAHLCKKARITDAMVSRFDKAHKDADEPGDLPAAPYRDQHAAAMAAEQFLATVLGVDWEKHERRLARLFAKK
jgi:hypothetical protein